MKLKRKWNRWTHTFALRIVVVAVLATVALLPAVVAAARAITVLLVAGRRDRTARVALAICKKGRLNPDLLRR